ncbi:ParB/RepB/Spo0J family partition protein [Kitasatospora azatica]|uniref:ParB/RepB/Spo0J family partition protein n=1 Tax=Kitasatospora azatica TaxID=58347 RepID=UPI000566EF67|nr:ParB/RepB/Spo0J family partition protein [Kitasatospora azatica]
MTTAVRTEAPPSDPFRGIGLTSVHLVPIARLRTADSPRAAAEDPGHLRSLAVAESALPPIVVHRPSMRIIDGTHRVRAALLRGRTEIEVRYFDGTEADAFVLAVESNIGHGLPLSQAERSAAAERILASHPHWADRAIASVAGLSAHTVAALRRAQQSEQARPAARLGRDGRLRPVSTAQGRREAGRLLTEAPDTSLREIAKRTGLAPATVRDVRDRLLRGEDPVPAPRTPAAAAAVVPVAGAAPAAGSVPAPAAVPGPAAATGAGVSPAAAANPADQYRRLARDPALHQHETGRQLLRLLSIAALPAADWDTLAEAVPPHHAAAVAELAAAAAEAWRAFAERAS